MLNHNHEPVTRVSYPAELTKHLHELHGQTADDLQFLSTNGLGDVHARLHTLRDQMVNVKITADTSGLEEALEEVQRQIANLEETAELCRRIRTGEFDRFLEDILTAAHGRKISRRQARRGR